MLKRAAICLAAVCLLTAAGAAGQEILTQSPAAEPDSTTLAAPPVAGLAAAPAQPVADQVWQPVLVVTDEGWKLPDCSLRWLDDGSRVRVTRADGSWRDFLPWTITSVFANGGLDMTAAIAAARPGGVRATPPLPGARGDYQEIGSAMPLTAGLGGGFEQPRPFGFAITVGGGYAMFAGDWYRGFEPDVSLYVAARIGIGGRTWLTLGYRRQGGDTQSGNVYDYGIDDYVSIAIDLRVDEYMLMVGHRTNASATNRNIGYAEFGIVALNHVANAEVSYYGTGSYSEIKLGLAAQFGGLIALGEDFVLDLGVDLAFKPGIFDEYETSGFIVGGHAGLGFISW